MLGHLSRTSNCKNLLVSRIKHCCNQSSTVKTSCVYVTTILNERKTEISYSKRCLYLQTANKLTSGNLLQNKDLSKIVARKFSRLIKQNGKKPCCYEHRNFYSDFRNDDQVKAWLSEIEEDFKKEKSTKSDNDNETGVKNGDTSKAASDTDDDYKNEKLDNSVKDSPETLSELTKLANKWATPSSSTVTNNSSFKSSEISADSGTGTKTDSDVDIDDVKDHIDVDLDTLEKQGFTAEEIIELLRKNKNNSTSQEEDGYEEDDDVELGHSENAEKSGEETDWTGSERDKRNVSSENDEIDSKSSENDSKSGIIEKSPKRDLKDDWAVVELKHFTPKSELKTDWSVVEIEDFVNIIEEEADVEDKWQAPVELIPGKTGVYDIEDLVTVLRSANAVDLAVIKIAPQANFADYMVIVSAKSARHMKAIAADVRWIYKKKMLQKDRVVKIEGEGEDSDWYAMDMGNIVLHIFLPKTRELYDLETLWTVGPKYDPKCMEEPNPYVFSVDDLPWLEELEQPETSKQTHQK